MFTIVDFRPFRGIGTKGVTIADPQELAQFGGTGLAKIAESLGKPVAGGRFRMKVEAAALKVWEMLQEASLPEIEAEAKKSTRPGVIATIMATLQRPEGATFKEVLEVLMAEFPDRDAEKMAATARAQINRLPEEKGLAMKKVRADGQLRYFLANS